MAAKLLAEVEAPDVWLLVDIVIADVNWEGHKSSTESR